MISTIMISPHEMAEHLAKKAKTKRLSLNLSQQTLAEHSGVSYGVLKKFERTGQISLVSLLKLALCLDALENFHGLFDLTKPENAISLDALIESSKTRKRGRK
jgi:transcriptional regulator with XRE-family HTH domain